MDILGVLAVAVMLMAPVALGIATAWGLYYWTKKRWTWALAPVFVLAWMTCVTAPMVGMGLYLPYRAKAAAGARPAPAAPPPQAAPAPEEVESAEAPGVPEEPTRPAE